MNFYLERNESDRYVSLENTSHHTNTQWLSFTKRQKIHSVKGLSYHWRKSSLSQKANLGCASLIRIWLKRSCSLWWSSARRQAFIFSIAEALSKKTTECHPKAWWKAWLRLHNLSTTWQPRKSSSASSWSKDNLSSMISYGMKQLGCLKRQIKCRSGMKSTDLRFSHHFH